MRAQSRIGHGYDLHRLEPCAPEGTGRPFVLGGIRFDHDRGPVAHSDGDVLMHAVTDAILGAVALGDIGAGQIESGRLFGFGGGSACGRGFFGAGHFIAGLFRQMASEHHVAGDRHAEHGHQACQHATENLVPLKAVHVEAPMCARLPKG